MTTATGTPAFLHRRTIWRLKEGETVKIGDWQSYNVFMGYPLTVIGRGESSHVLDAWNATIGKEGTTWKLMVESKAQENGTIDGSKHSHDKPPANFFRVRSTNTPYLKVVGIEQKISLRLQLVDHESSGTIYWATRLRKNGTGRKFITIRALTIRVRGQSLSDGESDAVHSNLQL